MPDRTDERCAVSLGRWVGSPACLEPPAIERCAIWFGVIAMAKKSDRSNGGAPHTPANDNGARRHKEDPRILGIAAAIGRKMARDELKLARAANDNVSDSSRGTPEEAD